MISEQLPMPYRKYAVFKEQKRQSDEGNRFSLRSIGCDNCRIPLFYTDRKMQEWHASPLFGEVLCPQDGQPHIALAYHAL